MNNFTDNKLIGGVVGIWCEGWRETRRK